MKLLLDELRPFAAVQLMLGGNAELDDFRRRWQSGVMSKDAEKLLDAFDALPQTERQEVVVEILRRAALVGYNLPDEAELVALADRVFLDLDRCESEE